MYLRIDLLSSLVLINTNFYQVLYYKIAAIDSIKFLKYHKAPYSIKWLYIYIYKIGAKFINFNIMPNPMKLRKIHESRTV